MTIYRYAPDINNFDCFDYSGDWSEFESAEPIKAWKVRKLKYDAHAKRKGDFPSLASSIPVFSPRAWEALEQFLAGHVQALPIESKGGNFFAINVLTVVDCLDRSASEIEFYEDGDVLGVDHYAISTNRLKQEPMFRIPETKDMEILVSVEFKKLVKSHNLTGLQFEELP